MYVLIEFFHGVDPLLEEFKRREENCVDGRRAPHRHAETTVHIPPEELNLRDRNFLAFGIHQGISLVDTLHGIDRVW